jgi:hypothetical protein
MTQQTDHAPHPTTCCRGSYVPGRVLLGFAAVILCLVCAWQAAFAVPPQKFVINGPETVVAGDALSVSLSVSVDNEDGLRDMLRDGAVLALTIAVELERHRTWWTNETVLSKEFVSTIWHDPLTRDFTINLPGPDGDRQSRDKNLTRLLHATWRLLSVPVISLNKIPPEGPDAEYSILLGISLQHTEIPPWLKQSTVFWSSNVVPSVRFTLPFQPPKAPEPEPEGKE